MKADAVDNDLIVCWAAALYEVKLCSDNNSNMTEVAAVTEGND